MENKIIQSEISDRIASDLKYFLNDLKIHILTPHGMEPTSWNGIQIQVASANLKNSLDGITDCIRIRKHIQLFSTREVNGKSLGSLDKLRVRLMQAYTNYS